MLAVPAGADNWCDGCAYNGADDCEHPDARAGSTRCQAPERPDGTEVIWVSADDAAKSARLTDEQISDLIAQMWGSVDIAPQSAAAFARAVEAAALRANNLETP